MKRIFSREQIYGEFKQIKERTKVGVIALGSGSGATLLALALAQELESRSKATSFIELSGSGDGKALVYEMIGLEKRMAPAGYRMMFSEIENDRRINGWENTEAGINWAVLHPEENMRNLELSPLRETRLIHNFSGDYIVCDLGSCYRTERIEEMDIIFCIVDPLPSKLIANREMYQRLTAGPRKTVWILNKDNGGIHRRLFYSYMKIKGHETVPMMKGELLYKAEYNCRLPYEQKEIKEILKPIMEKIVNRHILITKG